MRTRQCPSRWQRFRGHLRRALALDPAHGAGLVLPEVVRPGHRIGRKGLKFIFTAALGLS